VSGTTRKFWNDAIWSNFSAQMAAARPSVPRMPLAPSAKTSIHSGCRIGTSTKQHATSSTPAPTTMPRTMADST